MKDKDLEKEIEEEIKELMKRGEGLEPDEIASALYNLLSNEDLIQMAECLCFDACYLKDRGDLDKAFLKFSKAGRIYERLGKHNWADSCYKENFYVVEKSDFAYLVRFIPK